MKLQKTLIIGLVVAAITGFTMTADALELTFRYNFPDPKEVRAALDAYEKENPGIKIRMEGGSFSDARDHFLREAAVGEGPDIMHLAFVWVRDLGIAGALLRLNDLIANDGIGEEGWDDFIAKDLTYDDAGNIFGVPWATDTWAMVYRKDVLDEAGVTKIPETWDELRAASRQIKEKTGKTGFGFAGGASGGNTIWFLANFYWWSNDVSLVIRDEKGNYVPGIKVKDIADCIAYWHSYFLEGHNPEGNLGISLWHDPQVVEPLLRGTQGVGTLPIFTYHSFLKTWRTRNPGKELPFVSALVPHGTGKSTTHLGGQSIGINAATKHPKEAWKVVQFLCSYRVFKDYYKSYYPSQYSLLKKMPFPEEMKGFQQQYTVARSWGPYSTGPAAIGAMWNQTSRSFGSAFIGEKSYEEAAQELYDFIAEQLKKKR
jgi:multiple sugar transport system substrate-binding protein